MAQQAFFGAPEHEAASHLSASALAGPSTADGQARGCSEQLLLTPTRKQPSQPAGCFIHSLEQFPLSERPLHVRTALLSRCWNAHTQLPQAVPGPQTLARVRLRAPTQGTGSWAELPLGSLLWAVLGRTLFSSLGLPPSLPGWLGCSPGPLPGAGGTGRAGTHTVSFVPTRAPIAGA